MARTPTKRDSMFILSAGMPRSASTWVYNVLRLGLESHCRNSTEIMCGWIDDLRGVPANRCTLIKLHNLEEDLVRRADLIVYSFRDIRDALASSQRMFGNKPSILSAEHLLKQYRSWQGVADLTLRYEDLGDKRIPLRSLMNLIGVDQYNENDMLAVLDSLKADDPGRRNAQYHDSNLLHDGHITDGRVGSWRDELDPGFVKELETEFREWFQSNSYDLSS